MKNKQHHPTPFRLLIGLTLVIGLVALAACTPIQDTRSMEAAPAATAPAMEEATAPGVSPAQVTVSAASLRVRSGPSELAAVIAGARQGESYPVLGISSDGAWLLIEIDRSPTGEGWVASSFVILEGDITNIESIDIEGLEFELEEATPEPTEEPQPEATPVPTEEPVAEATPEPTEEPIAEATPEPTEEPVAEATPEPTEEPVAEATPVPTEEPVAEATPAPTEEPVAEATPEPTEEPVAEATPAPAEESAGFITVASGELPLRVRSTPTTDADNRIGNVQDGETYRVLEISEDGLWVRIEVPGLGPDNGGWVFAEFVVFTTAP
jgi:uncharacterized protein YgiM (DUF1202 family)